MIPKVGMVINSKKLLLRFRAGKQIIESTNDPIPSL